MKTISLTTALAGLLLTAAMVSAEDTSWTSTGEGTRTRDGNEWTYGGTVTGPRGNNAQVEGHSVLEDGTLRGERTYVDSEGNILRSVEQQKTRTGDTIEKERTTTNRQGETVHRRSDNRSRHRLHCREYRSETPTRRPACGPGGPLHAPRPPRTG